MFVFFGRGDQIYQLEWKIRRVNSVNSAGDYSPFLKQRINNIDIMGCMLHLNLKSTSFFLNVYVIWETN